jgi:hypothetical protein
MIAHQYDFSFLRSLAIERLLPIVNAVEKIVLARKYDIQGWLSGALFEICSRDGLPNDHEIVQLGYEVFVQIARAR